MQQQHRDAIQSNFTSLVERTDLDSVVTSLYEKGVFSEQMIEPYRNRNELERDRKRKLYMDITRRGPHAFRHLLDTLGELGYWDLARDLDPDSPFSYNRNFNPVPKPAPAQPADDDNFRSLSLTRPKNERRNVPRAASPPQPPPPPLPSENDHAAGDAAALPNFPVKMSTKFMEDDDTKDLKLYRTRGRNRGVLLDFTYMEFDNNIEDVRNGVDVDCKNLKYLFNELGFRVLRYLNLTKDETIDTLKLLKDVLVGVECVFMVVSSHGYERAGSSDNDVRCRDGGLVSRYQITDYFSNRDMPRLIGVPKVFIFQTCRGSNPEYALQAEGPHAPPPMPMPSGDVLLDVACDGQPVPPAPRPAPPAARARLAPLYSDILIANSTLPGLVSRRDPKSGSWYIQVLCEVFAERACDCHVEKLFTLVDRAMQDKFKVQTSSIDRWGFNKRLYLHPGLYET